MDEPPEPSPSDPLSNPSSKDRTQARRDIALQNPCGYPEAGARRLRPWLEPVLVSLAPQSGSFAARFVSDREMRRLNRAFRGLDRPTDVLSFPGDLSGGEPAAGYHLGDVAISVPAARRQAAGAGHPTERELQVLLLHGVLHCLGHDHERDGGVMERLERRLRSRFIPESGR